MRLVNENKKLLWNGYMILYSYDCQTLTKRANKYLTLRQGSSRTQFLLFMNSPTLLTETLQNYLTLSMSQKYAKCFCWFSAFTHLNKQAVKKTCQMKLLLNISMFTTQVLLPQKRIVLLSQGIRYHFNMWQLLKQVVFIRDNLSFL